MHMSPDQADRIVSGLNVKVLVRPVCPHKKT